MKMKKYLSPMGYSLAIAALGLSGIPTNPKPIGEPEPLVLVSVLEIQDSNEFQVPSPLPESEPKVFLTPTISLPPSSTTVEPKPRETIPLMEAKAQGLWGRPTFEGCVSKYGTPSPEWLGELFAQSSWPVESWNKLCRVIGCESNFNPQAYGGLHDRQGPRMKGLLQIDRRSWTSKWQSMGFTDMFDPLQNLEFGFWLYQTTRDNNDWNLWPPDQWTCDDA